MFFLDAVDAGLELGFFFWLFDLVGFVADVVDDGCQESAGAASGIENGLAELWSRLLDDELGDGSRRVEFTRVACGLEVFEDLFVNVAEDVPVFAASRVWALRLLFTYTFDQTLSQF